MCTIVLHSWNLKAAHGFIASKNHGWWVFEQPVHPSPVPWGLPPSGNHSTDGWPASHPKVAPSMWYSGDLSSFQTLFAGSLMVWKGDPGLRMCTELFLKGSLLGPWACGFTHFLLPPSQTPAETPLFTHCEQCGGALPRTWVWTPYLLLKCCDRRPGFLIPKVGRPLPTMWTCHGN